MNDCLAIVDFSSVQDDCRITQSAKISTRSVILVGSMAVWEREREGLLAETKLCHGTPIGKECVQGTSYAV